MGDTCILCEDEGTTKTLIPLRAARLRILHKWDEDPGRRSTDRAHKTCLAELGLYPFPEDVDVQKMIGPRLVERIEAIVRTRPDVPAPRALIQAVCDSIGPEMRIPDEPGRRHVRYLVAHWIMVNLGGKRFVCDLFQKEEEPIREHEVIEVLDPSCHPADWFPADRDEGDALWPGGLRLSQFRRLDAETMARVSALAERQIQSRERIEQLRIEAEERNNNRERAHLLEVVRLQTEADRTRATADLHRAGSEPDAKRSRRDPPATVTAEHPRHHNGRYSISHQVFDRLTVNVPEGAQAPDLRRAFNHVAAWFSGTVAHRNSMDVLTVIVDGTPVVYGWPRPDPRAFADGVREEDLYTATHHAMWPPSSPGGTAPPAELDTVPVQEQVGDVECVADLMGIAPVEWVSRPAAVPAVAPTFWAAWAALPEGDSLRVSQIMRALGWPGRLNYLLITAVAHRLDGWQWGARQPYPKAAARSLRRAAWLLRDLKEEDPLYDRLRASLCLWSC